MSLNWIISFCLGILVGQEFPNIPKIRPYVEVGIEKFIQLGKEISNNVEKRSAESKSVKPSSNNKRFW